MPPTSYPQIQTLQKKALQSLSGLNDTLQLLPKQSSKKRKIWLTADEHYHHKNILRYQTRPFSCLEEMDDALIKNHNQLVKDTDWTFHIGDFLFGTGEDFAKVVTKLNGYHGFLDGSHDRGLKEYFLSETLQEAHPINAILLPKLFEFKYNKHKIVLCHYALKTWWASHHGSFHFHGHSHGKLPPSKNMRDVGVDPCQFHPVLLEDALNSLQTYP
jgi:calcineurin-like phosphoesterase family protein